jgi:hypothetical protein
MRDYQAELSRSFILILLVTLVTLVTVSVCKPQLPGLELRPGYTRLQPPRRKKNLLRGPFRGASLTLHGSQYL